MCSALMGKNTYGSIEVDKKSVNGTNIHYHKQLCVLPLKFVSNGSENFQITVQDMEEITRTCLNYFGDGIYHIKKDDKDIGSIESKTLNLDNDEAIDKENLKKTRAIDIYTYSDELNMWSIRLEVDMCNKSKVILTDYSDDKGNTYWVEDGNIPPQILLENTRDLLLAFKAYYDTIFPQNIYVRKENIKSFSGLNF
ncbi:MAG: hypothetical protein AB1782_01840 [Cyanobacteriota bacterium]